MDTFGTLWTGGYRITENDAEHINLRVIGEFHVVFEPSINHLILLDNLENSFRTLLELS
jgi:hypothetical protein